jgi:hypothetical protein
MLASAIATAIASNFIAHAALSKKKIEKSDLSKSSKCCSVSPSQLTIMGIFLYPSEMLLA